jgi:tetratricopeptide (TPR) repeat protein
LEGLLESELAECDTFFESHGISKEMRAHGSEATDQYFPQYLEECVNRNRFNKLWVYLTLGTWYFFNGRLEETVSLCLRAASEYPNDPRAYYCLGTIYYGISSHATDTDWTLLPSFADSPVEMQELARQVREHDEQNPQLTHAFRESKLVAAREEASTLALKYYRKTLTCNISNEDKRRVQIHIKLIEMQLSLWSSK